MVQLLKRTHKVNKQQWTAALAFVPLRRVRNPAGDKADPLNVQGIKIHRREMVIKPHLEGYPQGINPAGSLLSLEGQLDYNNNRSGKDD